MAGTSPAMTEWAMYGQQGGIRHARARRGHPRRDVSGTLPKETARPHVDGRDRPGHDEMGDVRPARRYPSCPRSSRASTSGSCGTVSERGRCVPAWRTGTSPAMTEWAMYGQHSGIRQARARRGHPRRDVSRTLLKGSPRLDVEDRYKPGPDGEGAWLPQETAILAPMAGPAPIRTRFSFRILRSHDRLGLRSARPPRPNEFRASGGGKSLEKQDS